MAKLVQSPAPKLRDDDAARQWVLQMPGKENSTDVLATPARSTWGGVQGSTTATPATTSGGEPLEELRVATANLHTKVCKLAVVLASVSFHTLLSK